MDESFHKRVKLMFTVVDRNMGEKVVKMYQREGLYVNMMLMGWGTANSDLLDLLGLGNAEKYVILTPVKETDVERIFSCLTDEIKIKKAGHGIAFTVPIVSVGGPKTLKYLAGVMRELMEKAKQNGGEQSGRPENV